jgi:Ni/Fe-hydrogenase subunit HybB-like protein
MMRSCGDKLSRIKLYVRIETDQIHMESNSDVTFYHILFWIRIRIRIVTPWVLLHTFALHCIA